MNKTSLAAIFVSVIALVLAGAVILKPAPKLGSYTNGGVTDANAQMNDLVLGSLGFSETLSTSTTYTPAQFCASTNERWLNTTATATSTLPSATSTYLACTGGFGAFGAWNASYVTNDSTNTVNVVAGTGMTFKCETNGVGTTTIIGGCTATQVSIPASTTVQVIGYWDGSSSTMRLQWGNMYY